jgi:hypothetical protein
VNRTIAFIAVLAALTASLSNRTARAADDRTRDRSVPVIYSTDLLHPYDDPDDHYDLATLFALPEFDLKAVVLDLGEKQKQKPGRIPLGQMMSLTDRPVPNATALSGKLKSPGDKALDQPADDQKGVDLLLKTLREAKTAVTIITAGSVRDICAAFNREPDLFRKMVARLYINIGATDNTVEWNVTLDLNAYLGLMRSGLPIYWCPCLPMQVCERSTYWKFRQSDILGTLPPPLLNYFIYALQQVPPEELDPLQALKADLRPWRHMIGTMDRNMWCTASFLHAAGRQVYTRGGQFDSSTTAPADARPADIFTFKPARVQLDDQGHTLSVTLSPDGPIRVFVVTDTANYQKAMTDCLRSLLANMPLK